MKKKLAGILAVLMVLTMGTTVFAAPSSDKDSDLKKEAENLVTTVQSGSDSIVITPATVATEDLTAAYEVVTEKVGADTGFTVLAAVELTSATPLPTGGVQITFDVAGLSAGTKNIRIYHKKASGWEIKTPYVGNGYVTATFDSLSPFFIVKYDSTPSSSDGSTDSSTVINNYYTTNNTYNNTNSNNTTTSTATNSNNTTTTNTSTTNTTNTSTTTTTNTSTTTTTNTSTTTTTNADKNTSSTKKETAKKTETTKKDTTKKDTSKKDTSKKETTKKDQSTKVDNKNDSSDKNDNSSKNDNSNKNEQTVTININGDNGSSSTKAGASTSKTSPKTGASVPALPIIAVFSLMGIAVCGKKARNL